MKTIGDTIKKIRLEKDHTLGTLSTASGVSKAYLSQIENNETKGKISADILYKIAVVLDTTIANLLGKNLEKPKYDDIIIPSALNKAAIEYKWHDIDKKMLLAIEMRKNEKQLKRELTKEDWKYLYDTITRETDKD
jgi:transcriptional regulator with XRE-family HTH domain